MDISAKAPPNEGDMASSDAGYEYFKAWMQRKRCALCNDDGNDPEKGMGAFLGEYPLLITPTVIIDPSSIQRRDYFWVHESCAQFSPETYHASDGTWYNVATAVRRGRTLVSGCLSRYLF
jgi:hypothetical protein